jgi:DNA-binding PadR family transcriptional regulator
MFVRYLTNMESGRISNLEATILAALGATERYGLDIVREIERLTGRPASIGSLYVTLHRTEKKGLVTARWGEATEERHGARRRYYRLTGVGEAALDETRRKLERVFFARPEVATGEGVNVPPHRFRAVHSSGGDINLDRRCFAEHKNGGVEHCTADR